MRANEYQTRAMSTRLPSCENATYMLFDLAAEWHTGSRQSLRKRHSPAGGIADF